MINNIAAKVLKSPRIIERKPKTKNNTTKISTVPIRVVLCFESDKELVSTIHKYEPQLKNTCSFSRDEKLSRRYQKSSFKKQQQPFPVC